MNLMQLTYFVTVAEVLNLHKAADLLYISQPALSQALSKLERELSAKLFDRSGHRMILTKYGLMYYKRAKAVLAEIETANIELQHMVDAHEGLVDLAYIPTLSHCFIPDFLRDFSETAPKEKYHFHLHSDISANISQGILNQEYDLGFVSRSFENPELEFIQAFATEIIIIVPQNHPLAMYDEVDIHALEGVPFIGYQRKSALYMPVTNIIRNNGLQIRYAMAAPEEDSIADLVEYGFGVSLVAKNLYMDKKNIKQIRIKGQQYCRMVHLVYHKNVYHTEPVRKLIEYVREEKIPGWMRESTADLGENYHIIL